MRDGQASESKRGVCHLEWFINSRCDYACARCVPETAAGGRPDLGLEACREALASFAAFAAGKDLEARITFYPRQAEFTEPFTVILAEVGELKRQGRIHQVACANRGDLPGDKICLYREAGVDVCRLTLDGPERVQDTLRRPGSFRDTLAAFREARASGLSVLPLVILVKHNAPHVAETLRLLLDEGFDGFTVQAGIRGDAGGAAAKATQHPDPDSPWNQSLSAGEYREVLIDALKVLDAMEDRNRACRARFILGHPLYARLFFELGRWDEYRRLAGRGAGPHTLDFALKPDGAVRCGNSLPEAGAFPGGSFATIYAAAHPMRWFERGAGLEAYMADKHRAFAKCRACPVMAHCRPILVAAQGQHLFYYPDTHCWVDDA